jgi:hypothetical protein
VVPVEKGEGKPLEQRPGAEAFGNGLEGKENGAAHRRGKAKSTAEIFARATAE